MTLLITGGAGFIGSALIRHLIQNTSERVVNLDKLTYAGNLQSLAAVAGSPRYTFEHADICDRAALERIFAQHQPRAVMHLAAESHVDRSIDSAGEFIQTNIVGTFTLLEAARAYFEKQPENQRAAFRFHHISTDEVYGDLHDSDGLFTETTSYAPSSPYSASKASGDHLVRAWQRTYRLPTLHHQLLQQLRPLPLPRKTHPHIILNALSGRPLPIYGDGSQIRDWLYVEDHARALHTVVTHGKTGETYNIGGHNEKTNLEVVRTVCALLEELAPRKPAGIARYTDLITHVPDRPGHDTRYAINAAKIERELGWTPQETFDSGIRKTVQWYLDNPDWWQNVLNGSYRLQRLGGR